MDHLESYRKFYAGRSFTAPFRFQFDNLRYGKDRAVGRGILNRQRDYLQICQDKGLMELHGKFLDLQINAAKHWGSYDYGHGYFYQSCAELKVTGYRCSEARIAEMELERLVKGKSVLEIGCNAGFIAVALAKEAASIDAFEINPYLIGVANLAKDYLGRSRANFFTSSFEDFEPSKAYEVVLSFANHSTFDNNTKHAVEEYFQKCKRCLAPGGLLLFESHAPELEDEAAVSRTLEILSRHFRITHRTILKTGNEADRNRTFAIAENSVQ